MNTEQLKTAKQLIQERLGSNVVFSIDGQMIGDINAQEIVVLVQDFANQEIKRAVEKDRESRWISVKERLPEEGTFEVLLKVEEPFFGTRTPRMIVAYYEHEEKRWKCDLTSREVYHGTHWQPLPEPPKL